MTSTQDDTNRSATLQRTEIPLYVQLSGVIRRKIEIGEWAVNSKIPSLEELADKFGVARVTARQAVKLLEKETLLVSRQGKGTFVSNALINKPCMTLHTRWTDLISLVEGTTVRMLEERDVDSFPHVESTVWNPPQSSHYMRRVHSKDGRPYNVIEIYLDQHVYNLAPEQFSTCPVLPILGHLKGVNVSNARQSLTIGAADVETAQLLGLPVGAPIANVRRIVVDDSNMAIYFGEIAYRGDYIRLDIDLNA